jgi:predicted RNase H-like HicB family nuclease
MTWHPERREVFSDKLVWSLPMDKLTYNVIVEQAEGNFSAYVPDLPGCVATGDTVEETLQEMKEAIRFHLEGLREDGLPIPKPSIVTRAVDIELPAA